MIIGLTGKNCSGKTTIAEYLKRQGFKFFSLSDIIREELNKEGKQSIKDNMIIKGNQLRKEFGPSILADMTAKKIKGNAVVDSIRNPDEIRRLREEKDFILLGIKAPLKVRYRRIIGRKRIGDDMSFEKFKELEEKEITTEKNAQQLDTCFKMADFIIENDGSLKGLHIKISQLLDL